MINQSTQRKSTPLITILKELQKLVDAASWEKVLTLVKAHTKDINKGTKESQNFLVQKIVEIVGREKWDQVFSSGERPSGVKSL